MTIHDQLDSFHRFASERLRNGSRDLTMPDLFELWALENPSATELADVAAIIRQGDIDIAAGRAESVEKVNEELRRKFNLSSE